LGSAGGTLVGGALGLQSLAAPALASELQRNQKRVLMIFLAGGMSQFESWDPKPGRPTGGPFLSIPTSVPGYTLCELMPAMAQRIAKYTAVIRSLELGRGEHTNEPLHGGKPKFGPVKYPSLGSMVAKELGQPESQIPYHVHLSNYPASLYMEVPGFLGSRYSPTYIGEQGISQGSGVLRLAPEGNKLPSSMTDREHLERARLRDQLSQTFLAGRERDATLASHHSAYGRVHGLMASDRLFDIEQEPAAVQARYGPTKFGKQALVARRLIEAGVPYVRVTRGFWDTHAQNFESHQQMVPELDHVLATLLDDLNDRGLLKHTLVVTFSEMGRTPRINGMMGRDHWGRLSVTLSGCGIKPGVIHGKTDPDGDKITEGQISVQEFFATIFQAVGIDPQKENDSQGRPVRLTDYLTKTVAAVLA
jgi:hypothetical protein